MKSFRSRSLFLVMSTRTTDKLNRKSAFWQETIFIILIDRWSTDVSDSFGFDGKTKASNSLAWHGNAAEIKLVTS